MNLSKLQEGKRGEELAVTFLKTLGYLILDRNFRLRNGEIDIVCLDKERRTLVFVEVKTRSSDEFGSPLEAITWWKLKALTRAAQFYKISHRGLPDQMRIDAVLVQLSGTSDPTIEHVKNISG
ncbi:MAG: YraN family protein [Candidatus Levybacteria bacterium]|nr:YraN family protein [Candidatus Levybacteria bacterium]